MLDELHTNVRQAKHIQAKINNSIQSDENGTEDPVGAGTSTPPPPPPPPPRTSSRLSIDEDILPPPPPPPPELQSTMPLAYETSTLGRRKLPPIAPKPNIGSNNNSSSTSLCRVGGSPKMKHTYGTLPNPGKKSASASKSADFTRFSRSPGRRISFDDNIQLIDDTTTSLEQRSQHHPHHFHHTHHPPHSPLSHLSHHTHHHQSSVTGLPMHSSPSFMHTFQQETVNRLEGGLYPLLVGKAIFS